MCQFVETIREVDGMVQALSFHQDRMERTMKHFFPNLSVPQLSDELRSRHEERGVCKCRVTYGRHGIENVEYLPYAVRMVRTLRLITNDSIIYEYKSTDRSMLARLAALRNDCDEILIVRHGLLTDTSYSNIALFDGKQWFTPRKPLLYGTMRQRLIADKRLIERDIHPNDITNFQTISLINAMLDLERVTVSTEDVFLN